MGNEWYKWILWAKEKVSSGFNTGDPGRIQVEAKEAPLFICRLFDYSKICINVSRGFGVLGFWGFGFRV